MPIWLLPLRALTVPGKRPLLGFHGCVIWLSDRIQGTAPADEYHERAGGLSDPHDDECTAFALAEDRALTVAATSLSRASTCRSSFGCCRTCTPQQPRAQRLRPCYMMELCTSVSIKRLKLCTDGRSH